MSPKIHNLTLGQKNFLINTKEFSSTNRYENKPSIEKFIFIILTLFILKVIGEYLGREFTRIKTEREKIEKGEDRTYSKMGY